MTDSLRPGWYGRCPCGGRYEERWVEVRFTDPAGEPGLLTEVPQGACPVCGSRVYKVAVLQRIETAFKGGYEAGRDTPADGAADLPE